MEYLRAHAQRFAETRCALGHDHVFLQVDRRVAVRATVENVHHRHGQHFRVRSAEILEEFDAELCGSRVRVRERHAENGVRPELGLVRRAIKIDHGSVDPNLVERVLPDQFAGNGRVDVGHSLLNALAAEARLVAVAQFPGFMFAGAGAAGDGGTTNCAAGEFHVYFNGWVPA